MNMVNKQQFKWSEQKEFRMLPGMGSAGIFRMGSIHRNTYLTSPNLLQEDFSF